MNNLREKEKQAFANFLANSLALDGTTGLLYLCNEQRKISWTVTNKEIDLLLLKDKIMINDQRLKIKDNEDEDVVKTKILQLIDKVCENN